MSINSRLNSLEKKLNIKQMEIIVAFSNNKSILVKSDGSGKVNRKFQNMDEVKAFYRNRNAMLINMKNFKDIDEENLIKISENIEAQELRKENELNYDEMLALVKQKAEEIRNLE